MAANDTQVGGKHYKQADGGEEHWDRVSRMNLDYFQGQITKYVERWKNKNGIQDLEKARHFLDKYIEVERKKKAYADILASKAPAYDDGPNYTADDKNGPLALSLGTVIQAGQVKPTGWTQFVYEGGDAFGNMFRCRQCRVHFRAGIYDNPHNAHQTCNKLSEQSGDLPVVVGLPPCAKHQTPEGRWGCKVCDTSWDSEPAFRTCGLNNTEHTDGPTGAVGTLLDPQQRATDREEYPNV